MPRGNLEGITPRIMLLKEVIQLIKDAEYGRAFRLLRQHKLDINLIYDVDPVQFMSKIDKFVKEVKKVDFLNLFINSLENADRGKELEFMSPQREEDIIRKEHNEFALQFQVQIEKNISGLSKVNTVCEALKQTLEKVNHDNQYLLPILTTYIKRQPQELKQVLTRIQDM